MKRKQVQLECIELPSSEQASELNRRFDDYLQTQFPGIAPESADKLFMLEARDESGRLVGGIHANCYWDGLEILTLWVDESLRGQGMGATLVEQAEDYARKNGAVVAFLKTAEAKVFYQKLDYEVYGVLEDRPIGSQLFHMKKRLDVEP